MIESFNKSVLKSLFFYSFSTALVKAFPIISTPIILHFFSIEFLGLYNLAIILSIFLIPLYSLSGYAAIMREGVNSIQNAKFYFNQYSKCIFYIGLGCILCAFLFDYSNLRWITFATLNGFLEALYLNILTWFRARKKPILFFALNCLKTISLLLGIFIALNIRNTVIVLYFTHLFITCFFTIVGIGFIYYFNQSIIVNRKVKKNFRLTLVYTLPLVFHSISQWGINNVDRFVIQHIHDNTSLGRYSLLYNFSMISFIFIYGLSLALPPLVLKNSSKFKTTLFRMNLVKWYSLAFLIISQVCLFSYFIAGNWFIKVMLAEDFIIMSIILSSFYLLGLYHIYSLILFKLRKTDIITKQSYIVLTFNFICTWISVYFYGILGAAISTFCSYFLYFILIVFSSSNYDKSIVLKNIFNETKYGYAIISTITITGLCFLFFTRTG